MQMIIAKNRRFIRTHRYHRLELSPQKSGEVTCVKKTDKMMCRRLNWKDEPNGDILRIVYNEAIAVKGALGQSPNQMTSLAGSVLKTEANH